MINFDSQFHFFYSDKINDGGYFSGFGTRFLGDAKNKENIINFFSLHSDTFTKLIILEQIHSTNIAFYQKKSDEKIEKIDETDGVITTEANTVLTVKTADCLPIIFVEKKAGVIGIAHLGWRGSMKRLASKMVAAMVKNGAVARNLIAAIGPGIGSCCYDIPDDRYYQFLEEFDGYSSQIFRLHKGKRYVDLIKLNYLLLRDAGLDKNNIDFFPFCTYCDKNRFFSFRRDKQVPIAEMFHFIIKKEEQKLFVNI